MRTAPLLLCKLSSPLLGHPAAKCHALLKPACEPKRACAEQPVVVVDRRDNVCEQKLTTALREIARLRSLYLDAARCCETKQPCAVVDGRPPAVGEYPSTATDASLARRAYAPPALGEITDRADSQPPTGPAPVLHKRIVTNSGSLIDLLL